MAGQNGDFRSSLILPLSHAFSSLILFFVQGYRINHSESIIIGVGLRAVWLYSYFLALIAENSRKLVGTDLQNARPLLLRNCSASMQSYDYSEQNILWRIG